MKMNTEFKERLQIALRKVLFNDWNPSQSGYVKIEYNKVGSPNLTEKVNLIVSLCNYYNSNNDASEIYEDLKKLSESLVDYELLEKLTESLDRLTRKDFHWNPDFHHFHRDEMPQNITLSPNFQIGEIDLSSLISEIEKIRGNIENRKIDLNSLISFIASKSKELNDMENINKNE